MVLRDQRAQGTVAASGNDVNQGTVLRITLCTGDEGEPLRRVATTQIGSGFAERTDPAALVIGPTGVGLGRDGTLYVADTVGNRITAIQDALTRDSDAGTGREATTGGNLKGPLGLAIAPVGDILTVNSGDGNLVETTPRGAQVALRQLDASGTPMGAGALFGLAALAAERHAKGKRVRTPEASGGVDQVLARIFTAYAGLYLTVTSAVSRRQELAADLVAVKLAGRDAMASALRRLPVLDSVLDYYLGRYAMIGWEDGLLPLPGQVYGGLAHLLAEPARREELARLALEGPEAEQHPYDSHPPLAARIAAIEALPPDGRPPACSGPALGLLAFPEETIARVEAVTLRPESAAMRRLDWPELAQWIGRARHAQGTDALRQAVGMDLPAVALLAELTAGPIWQIADRLPKSRGPGPPPAGSPASSPARCCGPRCPTWS